MDGRLSTPAHKLEPASRRWQPIVSLVSEMSISQRARAVPSSGEDRFVVTKTVFYQGVLKGLQRKMILPEAALFLTGDMQLVGAFMEGEAMGLAISDRLFSWCEAGWQKLRDANLSKHPYEMHTGFGMGLGVLGINPDSLFERMQRKQTVWHWFAIDGFGFQQTLCDPEKYLKRQSRPQFQRMPAYAARVFDQGLGRSLWFLCKGDVSAIAEVIVSFGEHRRSDLWVGTGVAAAHTGGTSSDDLRALVEHSGVHKSYLAMGAAIAAHVRSVAKTNAGVTDDVCRILVGMNAEKASGLVQAAHVQITGHDPLAAHENWQQCILQLLK